MDSSLFSIPDAIRMIREREHLSATQAAARLGASLAAFTRWEKGTASPSPAQIEAIEAWAMGTPPGAGSAFASRGIRTQRASGGPAVADLLPIPGPPILDRISDGDYLVAAGSVPVAALIAQDRTAARTATTPPVTGTSAGKNTYTYDAHTYHTKVPPQGIAELLRHYLPEGGLVLDPFAGSGMTGVAAAASGMDCILNELSPAGAFISSRFTSAVSASAFWAAVTAVMQETDSIRRALYTTDCRECGADAELLYTVWSYRVQCPKCSYDFQLWDHCRQYGRTVREHKILSEFPCPGCAETVKKSSLSRTVAEPVQVGYVCCGNKSREVNHAPNDRDLAAWASIDAAPPYGSLGYPTDELPNGVNLRQPISHGLTSIDKFYTSKNLAAMSQLWSAIHRLEDPQVAAQVAFVFTGLYRRVTRLSEFRFWGGSGNSARLNVPFIFDEANVFRSFERKAKTVRDHLETTVTNYTGNVAIRIGSATDLSFMPDESVDMVFTDPPFGANINYSDMNFLWESWLGRQTDTTMEAIVNRVQGKDEDAYGKLMEESLREAFRVLRTGSWMLLVFMNSSARIWSQLNTAIHNAGFMVVSADVFDKQHGTFKHFVSPNTPGADLVLHCVKPTMGATADPERSGVSLTEFLSSVDAANYRQHFLHVDRTDEPDMRRLYSEWMSKSLVNGGVLMDFADFRERVSAIWGLKGDQP